jgi:hypothetical protein
VSGRPRVNHGEPNTASEAATKPDVTADVADDTQCRPDADGGVSQRVIHRLHRLRRLPEEGEELREKTADERRWTQIQP